MTAATATPTTSAKVRLAELVAALSLGVDLGFGQPMEHVLRECMIALRLADRLGLDEAERSTVYYTALLVNVGCHADAHEQAKWFGDDIALRSGKYEHEYRSLRAAAATMSLVGSGNPPLHRFRVGLEFALSGRRDFDGMIERHSSFARALAERLGLQSAVQEAVGASYEQWDGKGWPGGLAGDRIPIAARLSQFAEFVEVAHRLGGVKAALALAERRAGSQFDPSLSAALRADPEGVLGGLDSTQTWDSVIDAEPSLRVTVAGDDFDRALLAIADFVDLKSPYTLGHARAVADLAAETAIRLGLPEDEVIMLRRAALVHDLGRLGVSNAIWDKPGPLGAGEWERVRMHPYLTERMLHQSAALTPAFEQGHRDAARDHAEDGTQSHRAHLREDRRVLAGRCELVRHRARPALKDGANASGGGVRALLVSSHEPTQELLRTDVRPFFPCGRGGRTTGNAQEPARWSPRPSPRDRRRHRSQSPAPQRHRLARNHRAGAADASPA